MKKELMNLNTKIMNFKSESKDLKPLMKNYNTMCLAPEQKSNNSFKKDNNKEKILSTNRECFKTLTFKMNWTRPNNTLKKWKCTYLPLNFSLLKIIAIYKKNFQEKKSKIKNFKKILIKLFKKKHTS